MGWSAWNLIPVFKRHPKRMRVVSVSVASEDEQMRLYRLQVARGGTWVDMGYSTYRVHQAIGFQDGLHAMRPGQGTRIVWSLPSGRETIFRQLDGSKDTDRDRVVMDSTCHDAL